MRIFIFSLLCVFTLATFVNCISIPNEPHQLDSNFLLNGIWKITFTDPRNIKNVYASDKYFIFENNKELEYNSVIDYRNGITDAEANIVENNNSDLHYIKYFTKGNNFGKYQRIESKINENNILQYHYTLCKTLAEAKKNNIIIAIGNGKRIESVN